MHKAVFKEMGEYVLIMQNTVAQYIVTQPIMDLCEDTVHIPGTWVKKGGGNSRDWNVWKQG